MNREALFLVGLALAAYAWASRRPRKRSRIDVEFAEAAAIAVLLAAVFNQFVAQLVRIPSESMGKTLLVGDHLIVNKFAYGLKVPFSDLRLPPAKRVARGDIVVFSLPNPDRRDRIKRVIGLPGETVAVKDGRVLVNGVPLGGEPYAVAGNFGPVTVPAGSYFVMGDNRGMVSGSLRWGPVAKKDILGKAWLIYWPPSRAGLVR